MSGVDPPSPIEPTRHSAPEPKQRLDWRAACCAGLGATKPSTLDDGSHRAPCDLWNNCSLRRPRPAAVVAAAQDMLVPPGSTWRLARRFGASYRAVHRAGHWLVGDARHAQAICTAVLSLLPAQEGPASLRAARARACKDENSRRRGGHQADAAAERDRGR